VTTNTELSPWDLALSCFDRVIPSLYLANPRPGSQRERERERENCLLS
jgi:hypothetical protein